MAFSSFQHQLFISPIYFNSQILIPTSLFTFITFFLRYQKKSQPPCLIFPPCSTSLNHLHLHSPPPKKNYTIIIHNLFPSFLLFFAFLQANQAILQRLPTRIISFSPPSPHILFLNRTVYFKTQIAAPNMMAAPVILKN